MKSSWSGSCKPGRPAHELCAALLRNGAAAGGTSPADAAHSHFMKTNATPAIDYPLTGGLWDAVPWLLAGIVVIGVAAVVLVRHREVVYTLAAVFVIIAGTVATFAFLDARADLHDPHTQTVKGWVNGEVGARLTDSQTEQLIGGNLVDTSIDGERETIGLRFTNSGSASIYRLADTR